MLSTFQISGLVLVGLGLCLATLLLAGKTRLGKPRKHFYHEELNDGLDNSIGSRWLSYSDMFYDNFWTRTFWSVAVLCLLSGLLIICNITYPFDLVTYVYSKLQELPNPHL